MRIGTCDLQQFWSRKSSPIAKSLPPASLAEKRVVRGDDSILSPSRHQSQLVLWQDFGHHPVLPDDVTIVFTTAGRMNRTCARPRHGTLFRELVDDEIARLIWVILQGST